jgi:hypothetical protein
MKTLMMALLYQTSKCYLNISVCSQVVNRGFFNVLRMRSEKL